VKRKTGLPVYDLAKKGRPTIERRYDSLQSSEDKAAYNRAKIRRPTEYTENTELQETEIDATGIKIHGKHGITRDRDRCRRHHKTRNGVKKESRQLILFRVFCVFRRHPDFFPGWLPNAGGDAGVPG
jgi:hypothetical protein